MTTHFTSAIQLPPAAAARSDDDFDYIPWWTGTAMRSVLDTVNTSTWSLLCDLITDPHTVPDQRLRDGTGAVLDLMEALWMRRPVRPPPTPGNRQLPDRFAPPTTTAPQMRPALEPTGAAWCLARLATFLRHLRHPGDRYHRLGEAAAAAWHILVVDEGSYLYTADLAARYDSDRPHEPAFIDAITTTARTRLSSRDTIELGAGTGAITRIAAPHTRSLRAIEPAVGMRNMLRQHTLGLDQVRVHGADCMNLDLPDNSADIVFEHAALCFVDEPLFAVAEAARVLRPGGALVRIISSLHPPEPVAAFAAAFHAELRRCGHRRGRIVSAGNDQRITDWLTTHGIDTHFDTIATWTTQHPLHRYATPLLHGSYPYLATIPDDDRHQAIDAALTATKLDWNTPLTSTSTVVTATTRPAPRIPAPQPGTPE
jgi:ubiquinone/menaquinone biosynthesis C-methylase UbiE